MKQKQYKFEGEWRFHADLVGESWVLFESKLADEKTINAIIMDPREKAHLVNWNLLFFESVFGRNLDLTEGVVDDMATALMDKQLEGVNWIKVAKDDLFGLDIFLHCTGEQGLA